MMAKSAPLDRFKAIEIDVIMFAALVYYINPSTMTGNNSDL
jgi:hypothetical protein